MASLTSEFAFIGMPAKLTGTKENWVVFPHGMFSRAATATRAILLRHPLFLQPVVTFAPPPLRAASFPLDMDGNSMFVHRSANIPHHLLTPPCSVNPKAGLSPTIDTRSWDGNIDVKRSRLLYRARQTGWLETDLLCGAFASGFPYADVVHPSYSCSFFFVQPTSNL